MKSLALAIVAALTLSSCEKEDLTLEVTLYDGTILYNLPVDNVHRHGWSKDDYRVGISSIPDSTSEQDSLAQIKSTFTVNSILSD